MLRKKTKKAGHDSTALLDEIFFAASFIGPIRMHLSFLRAAKLRIVTRLLSNYFGTRFATLKDGKSPTLGLSLDLMLNLLQISGVVRKGGRSMFWLLIISVAVGLFVNRIIKATRGDGYLPDVEDEGEI